MPVNTSAPLVAAPSHTAGIAPVRLLVVKISSMGDLVHTLSALQEACDLVPGLKVDWVCEEGFVDIPRLLPCVDTVIPVAIRRWKTTWRTAETQADIKRFVHVLRSTEYDCVIDAQGLMKSAWITALARCPSGARWGFDWASSRESLATLAVGHRVFAPRDWHAIERLRTLFSGALKYPPRGGISWINCGLAGVAGGSAAQGYPDGRSVLFLHGTTRPEKSWPLDHWISLGKALVQQGYRVLIPWASDQEHGQAIRMAQSIGPSAKLLERQPIRDLAGLICEVSAVVGVDSGLMHLGVALGRPTVAVMAASHLERYSASRFGPSWAPHARVVQRDPPDAQIAPDQVLHALRELVS